MVALILVSVLFQSLQYGASASVSINTTFGSLNGNVEDVDFNGSVKSVATFLGIPFAEPPLGTLRFQKPVPISRLPTGTYNATFQRPACMQVGLEKTSEDCLYLNVYVPYDSKSGIDVKANRTVMIWIYGGAFVIGDTHAYRGGTFTAFNDVILVTVNYRLNIFGFLSTHDSASLGNYGLWDQQMGIKWVHDNIADYGGDPNKVTLFGESAGSASVIYQSLYAGNKGLFRNVIAESGSAASSWAFSVPGGDMDILVRNVSEKVGCKKLWGRELVDCLRKKSAKELVLGITIFGKGLFSPVEDGDFVYSNKSILSKINGKSKAPVSEKMSSASLDFFRSLNIMMGVNNEDGTVLLEPWVKLVFDYNHDDIWTKGIPRYVFENQGMPLAMTLLFNSTNSQLVKTFVNAYTNVTCPDDPFCNIGKVIEYGTDSNFYMPMIKTLDVHSMSNQEASTYCYVYSHQSHYLPFRRPKWSHGAGHGEEVKYVFGWPSSTSDRTNFTANIDEVNLSAKLMRMWTNFAKSGDPNSPVPVDTKPAWPQYDSVNRSYMSIDANLTDDIRQQYKPERLDFWMTTVPALLKTQGIQPPKQGPPSV